MQNIIILATLILVIFLISKLQLLFIYFFIATVLSITINPLSNKIAKLKFWKFQINNTLSSIICLSIITLIGSLLAYIISPLIIEEIQIISSIQISEIQNFLNALTNEVNRKINALNFNFEANFIDLLDILNISSISGLFQSMLGILGNIFMAIFSILFISFFLIKDKVILKEKAIKMASYLIPKSKEKINIIIYFIRRYFIGLCIQTSILFFLFGLGMMLLKLPNPWTLAIFAAVINIVPYFGPLIGFTFTTTIIGTFYLDQGMIEMILPLISKSFLLFFFVQSIDNFFLQPTIYAKAFNAHPLEIFLVAMSAGFIGGILWMIIAMPVYTIIRIVFSELLTKFN